MDADDTSSATFSRRRSDASISASISPAAASPRGRGPRRVRPCPPASRGVPERPLLPSRPFPPARPPPREEEAPRRPEPTAKRAAAATATARMNPFSLAAALARRRETRRFARKRATATAGAGREGSETARTETARSSADPEPATVRGLRPPAAIRSRFERVGAAWRRVVGWCALPEFSAAVAALAASGAKDTSSRPTRVEEANAAHASPGRGWRWWRARRRFDPSPRRTPPIDRRPRTKPTVVQHYGFAGRARRRRGDIIPNART